MVGGESWQMAVAMFLTVTLSAITVVLFLQWWGEYQRGRDIRRSLQSLSEPSQDQNPSGSIFRQAREYTRLDLLLSRLPRASDMTILLQQANSQLYLSTFLGLSLGLGAAVGLAVLVTWESWLAAIALGGVAGFLPTAFLLRRRRRRLAQIEEQLPEAIDLLARAIRAGHPLSMGMRMVGDESPEPIATLFRRVSEEQRFGMSFQESLLGLMDRAPLVDTRILATAMLIQHEVGGNLAETLDNIAHTIRSRFTIRRQLRVYTAQGRMSGYILAALPPAVGTVIYFLDPSYIQLLFTDPSGRLMLGTALVLQVCGFLWIRRIIRIEV